MEAEGLSSVCSRPLSTRVSSASEGPLVCSKFLELSVRPSVHPSPLPQCSPPASPWSPSVCPLPSWLPITPSDPASGHPLDPVLWELRPRPTLAAPCLSAASLFFTTGLRPGYPLGLASRPWDPARPSRRGASSSLALFFPSLCVSPHLSPGWAWLQSPPSPRCRSLRPLLWWSLPNPDASPVGAQPGERKGWRRREVKSQAIELPHFPNSPVCPCQGGESPLSPPLEPGEKDLV